MPRRPPRSDRQGSEAPRSFRRLSGSGQTAQEVELGYVSGVFGVRGEVRLFLHHRESDLFAQWRDAVLIAPSGARYGVRLRAREGAGKRVLGAFEGVQGRNEVEGLKDWRLVIPEAELPRLEDDEFYLREVVGAEVVVGDTVVGKVVQVHETQSADILEVDVGADSSAFVPCLEEFVVSIEPGRVELTPDALEEG